MRIILGAVASIKTVKEAELIRQYYFQKVNKKKTNPALGRDQSGLWHLTWVSMKQNT